MKLPLPSHVGNNVAGARDNKPTETTIKLVRKARAGDERAFAELVTNPTLEAVPYSAACDRVANGATWIDVRFPDEREAVAVEGSLNLPLNALRLRAAEGYGAAGRQVVAAHPHDGTTGGGAQGRGERRERGGAVAVAVHRRVGPAVRVDHRDVDRSR